MRLEPSPAQRRIVEFPPDRGHLLVSAGPGSGKTRTITARIEWLLECGHASPEEIVVATDTPRHSTRGTKWSDR